MGGESRCGDMASDASIKPHTSSLVLQLMMMATTPRFLSLASPDGNLFELNPYSFFLFSYRIGFCTSLNRTYDYRNRFFPPKKRDRHRRNFFSPHNSQRIDANTDALSFQLWLCS